MRRGSMRLLVGASLCTLVTGCNIKSAHDDTQPVVTPPIVTNPPGTTLTATAKSGYLSATLTGVLGAPLAFAVDNQTQNATITQYTNSNIGLSAPDISPTKGQDQVTFTQFFTQQTPLQAAGGFFTTGTSASGALVTLYQGDTTLGLQYSDFGVWKSSATNSSAPQVLGVYAVGNASPATAIPKSGSVVFTGNALGTIANTQGSGVFGGLASLTVNFATNALLGNISDIRASSGFTISPTGSVNTIAFSGSVSGTGFSGQANVSGGAGTAFDITGASGTVGGNFYGPSATEAVGVFSLTGGTTQAQVMGSFGATQSFSSNDLSPTVLQLSALPNGTPLTANYGSGFVSMTQSIVTTPANGTTPASQTTTYAIDSLTAGSGGTSIVPANFVYYQNGTLSLQAPNIPYFLSQQTTNTIQTVQFAASAFTQVPNATADAVGLPYGAVQATALSNVPGYPQVAGDQVTLYRLAGTVGLQYSDFGEWTTGMQSVPGATSPTIASSYGVYGVGVATPTSQMPTTGTALYTGSAIGVLAYKPTVVAPAVATTVVTSVTGVAEVNANFATGALTGGIVGLRSPGGPGYYSDIDFTGTIKGNTFSGGAAAGTNASSIALAGAAGSFGGGFYGPNAKEITGTFSLSGGGVGAQLIGSFGAHK